AVFGTGGVGLSALILAKAIGARVVMVDVVAAKLAHALAHGADAVVNAADTDAPAAI
ncbi:MAG: zinc-binding dehydrogenase, partial [Rhodobacteraceae bacterium]|nr:zinc-binding dehydrogenase [Paracoccaceae bacterium]